MRCACDRRAIYLGSTSVGARSAYAAISGRDRVLRDGLASSSIGRSPGAEGPTRRRSRMRASRLRTPERGHAELRVRSRTIPSPAAYAHRDGLRCSSGRAAQGALAGPSASTEAPRISAGIRATVAELSTTFPRRRRGDRLARFVRRDRRRARLARAPGPGASPFDATRSPMAIWHDVACAARRSPQMTNATRAMDAMVLGDEAARTPARRRVAADRTVASRSSPSSRRIVMSGRSLGTPTVPRDGCSSR